MQVAWLRHDVVLTAFWPQLHSHVIIWYTLKWGGVDLGILSAISKVRSRDLISCPEIAERSFSPLAPPVASYFKPPSPAAFI